MTGTDDPQVILGVSGLTKRFGGLVAVDDMSFDVRRGQVLGIIGPNGAGKSTLFNLISGVDRPTSGRVTMLGDDITGKSSSAVVAHAMAKTFQLAAPMPHMTVRQVLTLAASSKRGRAAAEAVGMEAYVGEIADELGLSPLLDEFTDELNVAALRLVDIGRAMATNPELLLLDEPFSSLAHDETERVSAVLRDLRQKGITMVMVEHKLPALMRLVDEVIVMNFGKQIARGAPREVVDDEQVIEAYLGTKSTRIFDEPS
jgi:ABC-type branched-subunit amino acid transport system ATPase component